MRAVIVVLAAVVVGGLVIIAAVLPALENAKAEALVIGEEAGKVMWRVGAFYEANGRFPANAAEMRLAGVAAREYRPHDSEATRRLDLSYSVRGGEVIVQHASGKATFVAVLEERSVARWRLKDSSYSSSARGPIEFGAAAAQRCLREPALQALPECGRLLAAREAFSYFIGADPKDGEAIREGFARRFPPGTELKVVTEAAPRVLRSAQCAPGRPAEYVCNYSFEQDAERRTGYSVMFLLDDAGTRVRNIAVSKGL